MNRIVCIILLVLLSVSTIHAKEDAKSFRDFLSGLLKSQESEQVITGKDGWLFLKEELVHVAAGRFWGEDAARVSKAKKPEFADPLPAIIDFNNQLQQANIQLLFVPIPPKAIIYPDMLSDSHDEKLVSELAKTYQEFYTILDEQGVKVLDLIPSFSELRSKEDVYCKTDTHYSGTTLVHVAERIAEELHTLKAITEDQPKREYDQKYKPTEITGDLATMLGNDAATETVSLPYVTDKESGEQVSTIEESPVLLMGDSHTLVFSAGGDMHATGAGLAENLTATLGFPVDLLGIRGSGSTPVRIKLYQKIRKQKEYLKTKKVVVWVLTAREFTGLAGWRTIPVTPK